VLVTLDEMGSIFCNEKGETVHRPAIITPVVDETGAGDNFRVTFCEAYLLEGRKVEESLDFAAASAAIVVSRLGGMSGASREEVEAVLATGKVEIGGESSATVASTDNKTSKEQQDTRSKFNFPYKFASRLNSFKD